MGIVLEKDCITRPDGTLICIDKDTGKLLRFKKDVITTDDVSKEELYQLARNSRKTAFTDDEIIQVIAAMEAQHEHN